MPSRGGLRSPGRKVSMMGLHAPESQPEKRERERKREKERETKKTRVPKLDEAKVL